jgi:hypothetical protein
MNRDEQFDTNLELARRVFGDMLDRDPATWPETDTTIVFLPIKSPELSQTNQATLDAMMAKHPGGTVVVFDYIVGRPPGMSAEDEEPESHTEPPARKRAR